jgi:RNA polymerase sigma-70 factor, ECF subfamily
MACRFTKFYHPSPQLTRIAASFDPDHCRGAAARCEATLWWHVMDVALAYSDVGSDQRSGLGGKRAGRPTRENRNLHREIEALIPRLTRYARALTRDLVAADDLVQDCLVRALGKIHLWEPGTDLRAWLFTILHNQHVSLARRDARQRARVELQPNTPGVSRPPDQAARLEMRDLERAIDKLPAEQRRVVLLVGLDGMQYDEAASIVNLPVGTVRSRVARGRETLRTMTGLFPSRHAQRSRSATEPPIRRRNQRRAVQ